MQNYLYPTMRNVDPWLSTNSETLNLVRFHRDVKKQGRDGSISQAAFLQLRSFLLPQKCIGKLTSVRGQSYGEPTTSSPHLSGIRCNTLGRKQQFA